MVTPTPSQPITLQEFAARRSVLTEYLRLRCAQANWQRAKEACEDLLALEAEYLIESQRTLGKYAPIVEAINAKVAG